MGRLCSSLFLFRVQGPSLRVRGYDSTLRGKAKGASHEFAIGEGRSISFACDVGSVEGKSAPSGLVFLWVADHAGVGKVMIMHDQNLFFHYSYVFRQFIICYAVVSKVTL